MTCFLKVHLEKQVDLLFYFGKLLYYSSDCFNSYKSIQFKIFLKSDLMSYFSRNLFNLTYVLKFLAHDY